MINIRLGSYHAQLDRAAELLEAAKKYPGSMDAVWISSLYGFPMLEKHRAHAEDLAKSAVLFREAGVRIDLQISNTIGHGEYMKSADNSGMDAYHLPRMIGHKGEKAEYAFCYRAPAFLQYITEETKIYVRALHPDTIWIDDDLRPDNHAPASYGCFCDSCMAAFNKRFGTALSREELVKKVNTENGKERKNFMDFIREGLATVAKTLKDAATSEDKNIRMAYQYCWTVRKSGGDMKHIFKALGEGTNRAPASRIGGGAYHDRTPYDLLIKQIQLSYAMAQLPEDVTYRVPEIENLPDIAYGKSAYGTALESTYALAYGQTGLSYAAVMRPYEPIYFYEGLLKTISQHRPYWNKLAQYSAETYTACPAIYNAGADKKFDNDCNFGYLSINQGNGPLTRLGFAESHESAHAPFFVLHSSQIGNMTDAEITELLQKPVTTDGGALLALEKRGFGDTLPVKATKVFDALTETYRKDDSLISHKVLGESFCQSTFMPGETDAYALKAGADCKIFGYLWNTREQKELGASTVVAKTTFGGKWAIFGYAFWTDFVSSRKQLQLRKALCEIAELPAYLEEILVPTTVIPRVDKAGRTAEVTIASVSHSPTEEMTLVVRNPAGNKFTYQNEQFSLSLTPERIEENALRFTLPAFTRGWDVATLFIE